jgi:coenzyme F420-reducing hydrogenase beta subunit
MCSNNYEIGSTFQVLEQMVKIIMVVVIAMVMIKGLDLEKKKEKNKKRLKAKVNLIGLFCFVDQDT